MFRVPQKHNGCIFKPFCALQEVLNQLGKELDDPRSILWKNFTDALLQFQNYIFTNQTIKAIHYAPINVFFNFKKALSLNISNQFCSMLLPLRFGDFRPCLTDVCRVPPPSSGPMSRLDREVRLGLLTGLQQSVLVISESLYIETNWISFEPHTPKMRAIFLVQRIGARTKHSCAFFWNWRSHFISTWIEHVILRKVWSDDGLMASLAAMMVLGSEYIFEYVKTTNINKLKEDLKKQMIKIDKYMVPVDFDSFGFDKFLLEINELQSSSDIENMGRAYLSGISPTDGYAMMLMGKCYVKYKEYQNGITCFISSICKSTSLYVMTFSLRYLSGICVKLNEYVIALRLLDRAYKLCTMYDTPITPLFVNRIYSRKRKKIKMKLKEVVCSFCGCKGKLKCCTGCMNAVYCSKSCQKRHWRSVHRKTCDKKWLQHYKTLKQHSIFCEHNFL